MFQTSYEPQRHRDAKKTGYKNAVIPAQAGTQILPSSSLGPRLRGDDDMFLTNTSLYLCASVVLLIFLDKPGENPFRFRQCCTGFECAALVQAGKRSGIGRHRQLIEHQGHR